jgi:hypothetical protein
MVNYLEIYFGICFALLVSGGTKGGGVMKTKTLLAGVMLAAMFATPIAAGDMEYFTCKEWNEQNEVGKQHVLAGYLAGLKLAIDDDEIYAYWPGRKPVNEVAPEVTRYCAEPKLEKEHLGIVITNHVTKAYRNRNVN